jgi:hypothetical protein
LIPIRRIARIYFVTRARNRFRKFCSRVAREGTKLRVR